jgi:hypothetical protein
MYGNEFKNKNNMDSGSAFTENNSQITKDVTVDSR